MAPKILAALLDEITPLPDAPFSYVEWGDNGEARPVITWNENLRFHIDLFGDTLDVTSDNFITRVSRELNRLLPDGFTGMVEWAEGGDDGDSPDLTFYVRLTADEGRLPLDTDADEAMAILWPAIATLFNITDPGTFGSEYLFTGVALSW